MSLDDVASHKVFAEKYHLPFPLLADIEHRVSRDYGVLWRLGPLMFARRQTFIIAPDGTVARHYREVDPKTHSARVVADLESLRVNR